MEQPVGESIQRTDNLVVQYFTECAYTVGGPANVDIFVVPQDTWT